MEEVEVADVVVEEVAEGAAVSEAARYTVGVDAAEDLLRGPLLDRAVGAVHEDAPGRAGAAIAHGEAVGNDCRDARMERKRPTPHARSRRH